MSVFADPPHVDETQYVTEGGDYRGGRKTSDPGRLKRRGLLPQFERKNEREKMATKKTKAKTAAWQRTEGKDPKGGLNRKGVASYRKENPGSKLQMAVTTKPSKLKPGSKAANRRKSFCARMSGMPGPMVGPNGKPTRKKLALDKWNC
jgi:hypothetical protein